MLVAEEDRAVERRRAAVVLRGDTAADRLAGALEAQQTGLVPRGVEQCHADAAGERHRRIRRGRGRRGVGARVAGVGVVAARNRDLADRRIRAGGLIHRDADARAVDGDVDAEQPAEIERVDVHAVAHDRSEDQLERLGAVLAHDVRAGRKRERRPGDDHDAVASHGRVFEAQYVEGRLERDEDVHPLADRFDAWCGAAVDLEREREARSGEFGSATEDGRYGEGERGKRRERATAR